jgi:hypothetical protein
MKFSVIIPGIKLSVLAFLTATQSMVTRLVKSLLKERQFHLYLDNLLYTGVSLNILKYEI